MTLLDETYIAFTNPADQLERGLECCRQGDWKTGFEHLSAVAQQQKKPGELPSRYYSFLGYGMALRQKRIDEGIKLCRYAIKREFYQPENYLNLARVYLLAERRDAAYKAIMKGLKVDPEFPGLQALHQSMGERKLPVLPFLARSNPLNRLLGSIRYAFRKRPARSPQEQPPREPAVHKVLNPQDSAKRG